MKKIWKSVVAIWLAGACVIACGDIRYPVCLPASAEMPAVVHAAVQKTSDDLQREAEAAKQEQQRLKQEQDALSAEIDKIRIKKNNMVDYIQELDKKSTKLSQEMEDNEESIKEIRVELDEIGEQKIEAELAKQNQYDTMKKRIRYLYENGNDGYLTLLLEAHNLSDLYSRAEYVSKVTEYDNQLLGKYQAACQSIVQLEEKMKEELEQLDELKQSLKIKKQSVSKLIKKKTVQLKAYEDRIGVSERELADFAAQISEKEEEMEKLLEQQRKKAEQEVAERQEKDGGGAGDDSNREEVPGKTNSSGYRWPLDVKGRITSYFGYRKSPTAGASSYHKGIDIAVPTGTKVVAAKAGTVVTASYSADAGNYVCISHGDGAYTYYMHCSSLCVSAGKKVSAGQKVALSGSTGISTGPHLHFAIYKNGSYVNPLKYVSP